MVDTDTATVRRPGPLLPARQAQEAAPRVPLAHPWPALAVLLGRPGTAEVSRDGLVLLFLLGAALVLRASGFLPSVINPDESLYAVQAQAWLRGGWPYVAVWDMHPVGAPALFTATFALFGESLASLRLLGVLAVAATGFALHRGVRAAGAGRATGLAAGLAYVACSALLDGLATNTEILLAPFVAGAMALGWAPRGGRCARGRGTGRARARDWARARARGGGRARGWAKRRGWAWCWAPACWWAWRW